MGTQWILFYGNPVNGFSVVGPFKTADEALAYGERKLSHECWWLDDMAWPEQEEV